MYLKVYFCLGLLGTGNSMSAAVLLNTNLPHQNYEIEKIVFCKIP